MGGYADASAVHQHHGLVLSGSSVATVDFPGAKFTELLGINYWGTIVGNYSSSTFYGPDAAFKLKNGVFTILHYPGSTRTQVGGISDKGVIVGNYTDNQSLQHGFVLANGIYTTLDNPNTNNGLTLPYDINSSGAIVGVYSGLRSFIYINGVFKDIAPSNSNATLVTGINGYGYVTGTANFNDGSQASFTAHCQ